MESWICNFYLSVAARNIVRADPSLRYTRILLDVNQPTDQLRFLFFLFRGFPTRTVYLYNDILQSSYSTMVGNPRIVFCFVCFFFQILFYSCFGLFVSVVFSFYFMGMNGALLLLLLLLLLFCFVLGFFWVRCSVHFCVHLLLLLLLSLLAYAFIVSVFLHSFVYFSAGWSLTCEIFCCLFCA